MRDLERIRRGIAPYAREQQVILRLLRKRKQFTEREFDGWFRGRPMMRFHRIDGDGFILGVGVNGFNEWAWWLDLVQHMMALDLVDAKKTLGVVTYLAVPPA